MQEKQRLAQMVDELNDIVFSKTFKAPSAWADRERKYKMEKIDWETKVERLQVCPFPRPPSPPAFAGCPRRPACRVVCLLRHGNPRHTTGGVRVNARVLGERCIPEPLRARSARGSRRWAKVAVSPTAGPNGEAAGGEQAVQGNQPCRRVRSPRSQAARPGEAHGDAPAGPALPGAPSPARLGLRRPQIRCHRECQAVQPSNCRTLSDSARHPRGVLPAGPQDHVGNVVAAPAGAGAEGGGGPPECRSRRPTRRAWRRSRRLTSCASRCGPPMGNSPMTAL